MHKKFLIIRFSSIGDIVLTTPVVRSLKKCHPNSEIHYLTKKQFFPLLQHDPHIDQFHLLEDNLSGIISNLQKIKFDGIIDLHKNIRTLKVKNKLKGEKCVFDKQNWQKYLLVNFKSNRMTEKHIVERYGKCLKNFGCNLDDEGLAFYLSKEIEEKAQNLITKNFDNQPIAVVLGANHQTKKWIDEYFIELLKKLKEPAILIGGKTEAKTAKSIQSKIKTPILNAIEFNDLLLSAALVKHSKYVIAHDTGFMHIAAAFQKKIYSIWGNTVPEFGMYPYKTPHEIIENKHLSCRPCSKIGYNKCPKKHFKCMREITPEIVFERITSPGS